MAYDGLSFKADQAAPHLGGNVSEGDPYTFSPAVWDYAINRFAVTSVLDLGSGLGYSSSYFFRKGLRVLAVDGLEENVRKAIYPTLKVDLCTAAIVCKVDLVHCHEVVEHIDEDYLENLLSSLCCGKYVLMTHALPGQGGYHHVNEQPQKYWVKHMKERGFSYLEEDSNRIRHLAWSEGAKYMAASGLIFAGPPWTS
jgi:SAM-dependent methyltransferase